MSWEETQHPSTITTVAGWRWWRKRWWTSPQCLLHGCYYGGHWWRFGGPGWRPSSQDQGQYMFCPSGSLCRGCLDTSTEWTLLQGFVYSSFVFAGKPSYNMAVGAGGLDSAYSLNDESTTSPPFLQVPGSSDNHLLGSQLSNPDLTSGTSMLDIAGDIKITVSADPTADTSEDPVDNIRIRFSPPVSRNKQTSSPTGDIKLHKQTNSPTGDIKLLISPDSPDCAINGSINNHSPSTPSVTITIDDDNGNKADELQWF